MEARSLQNNLLIHPLKPLLQAYDRRYSNSNLMGSLTAMRNLCLASFLSISTFSCMSAAMAKPCAVTFYKNSPAVENPSSVRKPGEVYYSPTVYEYNTLTKQARVCFRGEYCYNASTVNIGCKVDWSSEQKGLSPNTIMYRLK